MTQNEFDDPLLFDGDDDIGPAVPQERAVSLAEVWQNNPSLKLFVIVAAVGLALIGFLVFAGDEKAEPSVAGGAQEFTQTPGTAELPPAYEDAVRAASEDRAALAEQTGDSAFPTPIGVPDRIEAPEQVEDTDPLAAWRREFEERQAQKATAIVAPDPVVPQPNLDIPQMQPVVAAPVQPTFPPLPTSPAPERVNALSQAYAKQMEAILAGQAPTASTIIAQGILPVYEKPKTDASTTGPQANGANGAAAAPTTPTPPAAPKKVLISAGQIAYAQTLTEANSDVPGVILAEIASGPLAGARAIGSFQVAEEHLVLKFTRAIKDKKEYAIDTVALDPATTLAGVATDVNHHYLSRILIPAAAEFIKGYADAATQPETTIVIGTGSSSTTQSKLDPKDELLGGAGKAGEKLAEVIEQDQRRAVTIKVHTGTRIGLLFVSTVLDETLPDGTPTFPTTNQNANNGNGGIFNNTGYNNAGYNNGYNNGLPQSNSNLAPAPAATSVSGAPVQAAPTLAPAGFQPNRTTTYQQSQ